MSTEALHAKFESLTSCSFGYKRSRRGTYMNPATATKWRWFKAGFEHARAPLTPNPMTIKTYEPRDHQAQGRYYLRHVEAMTSYGLHAKSAIAGELAHRDIEIAVLRNALWKACGDDEEVVNGYIESQRET